MAWTAFWTIAGAMGEGRTVSQADRPLVIGGAAALAIVGLLLARTRTIAAVMVMLACAYVLSARHRDGVLDGGSAGIAIGAALALFICWPRLIEVPPPND